VGANAYRYRVENYRDPATGKVRGRWTYLGKAPVDGGVAPAPVPRRRSSDSRERLLAALGRLLERTDYREVTAGAVAAEAGLAHGTFYRSFKDVRDALRAAVEQVRDVVDRVALTTGAPLGSRDEERAKVRRWAATLLHAPVDQPGLLRAWHAVSESDPELAARRRRRREETAAGLSAYVEELNGAGLADVPHPAAVAGAVLSLLHGKVREAAAGEPCSAVDAQGVLDVVDRALFGRP
jgi:AcrR family transcriptional regulator